VLFKILKSGLFQFKVTLFAGYRFNEYALSRHERPLQRLRWLLQKPAHKNKKKRAAPWWYCAL
jgi:hypothetical protein